MRIVYFGMVACTPQLKIALSSEQYGLFAVQDDVLWSAASPCPDMCWSSEQRLPTVAAQGIAVGHLLTK